MKVPITPRSNVHLLERIEVTLQRRARDCSASALEQPDFLDLVSFIVLHADIVKSLSRRALETRTISRSSEQYRSSSIPLSIVSAKNLRAPGEKAGPRDAIWKCRNRSCPSTRVCSVAMDVIWIFWFDSTASQASRFAQLDHKYLSAEQRPATRQILNAISFQWPRRKNWI